jgi:hypothetical protein
VYGEFVAVVEVEKRGFEGEGGDWGFTELIGFREIDKGLDIPKPCGLPRRVSNSNSWNRGEGVLEGGICSAKVIELVEGALLDRGGDD